MTLLKADDATLSEIEIHRVELYPLYRAGHLPRAGGVYEQDARTLAYFRVFDEMREGAQAATDKILAGDGGITDGASEPGLE